MTAEIITFGSDESQDSQGFRFAFHGRCLDVLLDESGAAVTTDAIVEALRMLPVVAVDRQLIGRMLEQHVDQPGDLRFCLAEYPAPRSDEGCAVLVSADRFAAYLVPADPGGEPTDREATADPEEPSVGPPDAASPPLVSAAQVRALLAGGAIQAGVLDEVVDAFGEGAPLGDVVPVALGQRPAPGTNAHFEWRFDPQPVARPTPRDDGSVDFHALLTQRFVEEGAVLLVRHPPVPGTPGSDVFGVQIKVAPVKDRDLASLAGPNTTVQGDSLLASVAGQPVTRAGRIEVLPVFQVAGDLDYRVGNIDFPGDVVIQGDVRPGFTIHAGGSVVIRGLVEGATIVAASDLSLTGTVGEHRTVLDVGGNLRARYLHRTDAQVVGSAHIDRELFDCAITATRISTSANGRIVGGTVTAEAEVDAGALGAREGSLTIVRVTSDHPSAVIRARRGVHPGLQLELGAAHRRINDEIESASFWNAGGAIVSLPASADEQTAGEARAAQTPTT